MKSAVENLNPTRVKLTVEVPYEELKPSIEEAYTSIGQQVQIPGFRKGKVPARLIDQRFGRGMVVQEAVNAVLPDLYAKAIEDNDIRPLGQPEVEVTEVPVEAEGPLTFTAELDTRPEITLPDFADLKVEVEPLKVTDEDVEAELEALRTRFGTLVGVDRAAQDGDFTTIDLAATIGDEQIDDVSGVSYEIGSGTMLPGLDEALIGLKVGESKTFTAALAGGDREGEDAECTVTLQSLKERQLPEVDDEFAQLASEHDTVDELRADLTTQAEQRKRFEQGLQARDKVLEQLLEKVDVPLPESVVEAEVHSHLEGEDRLDDDEHRAEVDENTREALKTQLVLDKIVEQDGIEVSQEELIEYLIMSAQQYGMDPNQFAQALDQQGQVPAVLSEVARRKALASVLEKATVVDTDGNEVDLEELNTGDDAAESHDDAGESPADEADNTNADTDAPASEQASDDQPEADADGEPAKS
ncbi:trigger factor [Calidifontibacter sp. DB0510]|uniref:Trigger factor n=1 Tax=Metallococcus carri TaxID=1656884 RepID=A0A967B243_9MICO|nr:trigger factor [Metallococcus carri]NHN55885.1 trigger factor [Metallococcus carri]NOP38427.1 trigger factor [Calidifontibacter sp. DB2511S]